jgi:hypothetical protein
MRFNEIEQLTEGQWIVKSLDGVAKRFRDGTSPEAKAWAASVSKQPKATMKTDQSKIESFVWQTISTTSGWGDLDWVDLVNLYVIPSLWRGASQDQYGEAFSDAVFSAKSGDWDKLNGYLDAAVKAYSNQFDNFSDWAEAMSKPQE